MKLVKFTRWTEGYSAGEIAGFDDAHADKFVAAGYAGEVDRNGDPVEPTAPAEPQVQLVDPNVDVVTDDFTRKEERDADQAEDWERHQEAAAAEPPATQPAVDPTPAPVPEKAPAAPPRDKQVTGKDTRKKGGRR